MVAILLCWVLALSPIASGPDVTVPPLHADTEDARIAREAWELGVSAYERGDFQTAIAAFERAYRFSGRPGPLFSLGQAHRHHWETTHDPRQRMLAIRRFEQYLEVDADGRRALEAERWITELQRVDELEGLDMGAPTRLGLASGVPGTKARIDGDDAISLPATPDVKPGFHTIEVTAPGHLSTTRRVEVPDGSTLTLEFDLVPAPGQMKISGPAGATVDIDGRRIGALPIKQAILLPPGEHRLVVDQPGRVAFVRTLEVTALEDMTLHVTLPRTGQRKVALVTVGTGAVSIGASLGLTIAALVVQRRAARFDAQLRHPSGSLTEADNRERLSLVAQRDDFRTAAVTTGVVGGVLVLAGVVLIVTDRPSASRNRRIERQSAQVWIRRSAQQGLLGGRF